MDLKLERLSNLYFQRKEEFPNQYRYNDLKVLDNYSIDLGEYDLNTRYIIAENKYKIFVFIGKDSKLLFHGLYMERESDLDDEYRVITSDMAGLSLSQFVDKYYEILSKNI